MPLIRCKFCHEYVEEEQYEIHCKAHTKRRPDGQLTKYAELPEDERYAGSLEGVPKWYVHQICGATTGMPEYIVRTYLIDPFFYNNHTYCHGCQTHVPEWECFWKETGENVHQYKERLREQHLQSQRSQSVPAEPSPSTYPAAGNLLPGYRAPAPPAESQRPVSRPSAPLSFWEQLKQIWKKL